MYSFCSIKTSFVDLGLLKYDIGGVGGREGNIISARSRVTVSAGKSLGRESFTDMLVFSGLPLVDNERTGTDTSHYLG